MVAFGYTLMTERAGPRELVDFAARAEREFITPDDVAANISAA